MGFKLMKNFNQPYFAKSIKEFWGRWHISLSTWFRDYLYIPLGGNRVGKWRWYYNIFIVFLVSGLWHGANWTFIIWGCLHGFYQVFGQITANLRNKVVDVIGLAKLGPFYEFIQTATTFGLVSFAWIFFRAASLADAYYISTHMFSGFFDGVAAVKNSSFIREEILLPGQGRSMVLFSFGLLFLLLLLEHMQNKLSF
jgi:D-alanyl-lipoteichoic acid acyltransferase DltB (MBOAT superfamily)